MWVGVERGGVDIARYWSVWFDADIVFLLCFVGYLFYLDVIDIGFDFVMICRLVTVAQEVGSGVFMVLQLCWLDEFDVYFIKESVFGVWSK